MILGRLKVNKIEAVPQVVLNALFSTLQSPYTIKQTNVSLLLEAEGTPAVLL